MLTPFIIFTVSIAIICPEEVRLESPAAGIHSSSKKSAILNLKIKFLHHYHIVPLIFEVYNYYFKSYLNQSYPKYSTEGILIIFFPRPQQ